MEKGGEGCCSSIIFFCMVGTLNGGLCTVLTLGGMGSRHVISAPPIATSLCPPRRKLISPFKCLIQFLEGSEPGQDLKKYVFHSHLNRRG